MQQALHGDVSAIEQTCVVMIQSLMNFGHCPLHEVCFVDLSHLGVVDLLSLAPFPAQLAANTVVVGVETGPSICVALAVAECSL